MQKANVLSAGKLKRESLEKNDGKKRAAELAKLERDIAVGHYSYHIIGTIFKKIKIAKLYRDAGNKSFEEYVQKKWGYNKSNAHVLIGSSEVWDNLTENEFSEEQMPIAAKALYLLHALSVDEQLEYSRRQSKSPMEKDVEYRSKSSRMFWMKSILQKSASRNYGE